MTAHSMHRIYQVPKPDWSGPCSEIGDYPFFAIDSDRTDSETPAETRMREHAARVLCAGCPFRVRCALHGLEHEDYGVWGGLGERNRKSYGGRGKSGNGPAYPERTRAELRRAGFSEDDIAEIEDRWAERRPEVMADEEEVA